MRILNWQLMSHPMNWLTVLAMLVIAGFAGHLVLQWIADINPATGNQPPQAAYAQAPNSSTKS